MDLFHNASAVRLRSYNDKYLTAEDDEEGVTQDRTGSSRNTRWTVEYVAKLDNVIRLKSRYNKYLTATNQPFLLGKSGRKVLQTNPRRLDSSVEWEPIRVGNKLKLKTRYGNFLRGNGGLPPWRNSVTHDVPQRTMVKDLVLWDVEVLEIQAQSSPPPPSPSEDISSQLESFANISETANSTEYEEEIDFDAREHTLMEGRTIYYHIASDEYEDGGGETGGFAMIFNENSIEELTRRLEEDTGLKELVVCRRSPVNEKLFPLKLHLPPNISMQVIVVPLHSEVAKDLASPDTTL